VTICIASDAVSSSKQTRKRITLVRTEKFVFIRIIRTLVSWSAD